MGKLLEIKKINKKYVTFLRMNHLSDFGDFVNAYVFIDNANKKKDYEGNPPYVTFQDGKVLGIDTAHSFNENETFEERKKDAERQIREVIKFFKKKENTR